MDVLSITTFEKEDKLKMFWSKGNKTGFELKPGTKVVVPQTAVQCMFPSHTKETSTPNIIPVVTHGHGEKKVGVFCTPQTFGHGKNYGMHVFIPAGVKPGDMIEFEWVDEHCAAARLVSKGG